MRKKLVQKSLHVLAAALLAGSLLINSSAVYAGTVNDLSKSSNYAREAIQWMAGNDIISGDKQGNFNPKKTVSRAELVTLMVKALEIDVSNIPTQATFSDVPTTHWAFKYVEAANRAGVVSGIGNGKFGVNNTSTREQIATMMMNYLSVSKEAVLAAQGLGGLEKFNDQSKMSDWAKPSIQFAISNNLMSGTSSDEFAPAGSATKEQIAVILYKFLNSKEAINQAAEALRKPVVTFNGDILMLAAAPKIVNGEIFLPLEAFEKLGAEVIGDVQLNKITIKSTTQDGKNIYMMTDNKSAYVNYTGTGDPFADSAAQELITLNNAPQRVENEVFVPTQAVVDAIGMQVEWNQKTNLVAIKDSNSENNPILFNAMKNLFEYKGEYSSTMVMSMLENISGEEFSMNYTMQGAVNGLDSTSKTNFIVSMTGAPDEEFSYETVTIGNTVYDKDQDTGDWYEYEKTEADDLGIMYYDVATERAAGQQLLDAYSEIKIYNSGKTILNGEEVTKYQLSMSNDVLESIIPQDMLESGMGLEDIYNNGLYYKVEMYVNNQGQLVKQYVQLTAGIEEEDIMSVDVTVTVTSEYSNIGKDIEIVSPVK